MTNQIERFKLEKRERWLEWVDKIPAIEFPCSWKVKVIPPFCGAFARMLIEVPGQKKSKSVYLDVYETLGFFGEPYWEVYPFEGYVGRCAMNDVSRLLEMIAGEP